MLGEKKTRTRERKRDRERRKKARKRMSLVPRGCRTIDIPSDFSTGQSDRRRLMKAQENNKKTRLLKCMDMCTYICLYVCRYVRENVSVDGWMSGVGGRRADFRLFF